MALSDFIGVDATRALQASADARSKCMEIMERWGPYSLLKVAPRGAPMDNVGGYITLLQAISGKTPHQIEALLGLRTGKLRDGADIYRLSRLPVDGEFLPRGFTTLVDGLNLRAGLKQDSSGYRPGLGALQIVLLVQIPATRIASVRFNDRFEPGLHPRTAELYRR